MRATSPQPDSLVLYKKRPARVVNIGERLEIELDDRNRLKVRPKDVLVLHPGPVHDLAHALAAPSSADVLMAWEIFSENGQPSTLAELAELAFGEFTPASAWASWQLVEEGLFFHGTPEVVAARPADWVQREQETRRARQIETEARRDFLQRAAARVDPERDSRFLREVEDLALGRRLESRLVRELGRTERPESAHALLLEWGVWDWNANPHPQRLRMPLSASAADLPPLPQEARLDLTALQAYAIDDRGNQDPDDALTLVDCSLDTHGNFAGGKVWVHVADVAALVAPGSPADIEARSRGATLYLPEGAVQMLPPQAVPVLGLGLQPISPALSFEITLDAAAQVVTVDIRRTEIAVQRLSYDEVETQLDAEPFRSLQILGQAYQRRRQASGAFILDLPETTIKVSNGQVSIEPLRRLHSRNLVREMMLMAGEAIGGFALQNSIPVPYVLQELGLAEDEAQLLRAAAGEGMGMTAAGYALRRGMRRSRISSQVGVHTGVGLTAYTRATSPLRRYLDLVVHQQLGLWLQGRAVLDEAALLERLGDTDAITAGVALAENLSRRHWTLVYLLQNPGWQGEGVLVEINGKRATVLIPELALESTLHLRTELPLNSRLRLSVRDINLPELEAHFNLL